jgi:hypothetical protein
LRKDTQKKSAIGASVNEGRREIQCGIIDMDMLEMCAIEFFQPSGVLKLNEFAFLA